MNNLLNGRLTLPIPASRSRAAIPAMLALAADRVIRARCEADYAGLMAEAVGSELALSLARLARTKAKDEISHLVALWYLTSGLAADGDLARAWEERRKPEPFTHGGHRFSAEFEPADGWPGGFAWDGEPLLVVGQAT